MFQTNYLPICISVYCMYINISIYLCILYNIYYLGISVCGSGVGTFVFAPLTTVLLMNKYISIYLSALFAYQYLYLSMYNFFIYIYLGISVCGSGVGTFVFAPLTTVLLNEYGWKGANIIFAALCLQCAVSLKEYIFQTQIVFGEWN